MVKNNFISILVFLFFGIAIYAQKVSNISSRQEQSTIVVSYDLETKTPCKISLYVSTNGGSSWQGPLTKVTGDVGAKIIMGSRRISWKVLEEFEELRGDNIMFQVRADGDSFETVVIDTFIWTTKNLNVSKYKNGDLIPEVNDPTEWSKLTKGAWCYYDNDPNNGIKYGKLYNWYAVNDRRGLAPDGFHIPTDAEWKTITSFFIEIRGLPGGYRSIKGVFSKIGEDYNWWSFSESSVESAWQRDLDYDSGSVYRASSGKKNGFSVRCVKD